MKNLSLVFRSLALPVLLLTLNAAGAQEKQPLRYVDAATLTVIGKSMTVGLPTALLMMNEEATVSVCHILSQPEDTRKLCQQADIVISAAGCAGLIKADYVRPGQVVVDVGVNVGKDGVMRGDAAFEEVEPIVKAITPVPGRTG